MPLPYLPVHNYTRGRAFSSQTRPGKKKKGLIMKKKKSIVYDCFPDKRMPAIVHRQDI